MASSNILGISAFYHDSAAALIQDGHIAAAAQEERFTRKKYDDSFPLHAVEFCLEEAGLALGDLDAVVYYEKPLLKFERLLETYNVYAPRGLRSFIPAMSVWLKDKLFLKKHIREVLEPLGSWEKIPLLFSEHHLSHAASAFYPSPFEEAAIITVDGVGEWATLSIAHGRGREIILLKELHFPHSVGFLYSSFTYYTGFRVNSGEYKLMGLAPYGNPQKALQYESLIRDNMIDIKEDGSLWINQDYFDYVTGLTMAEVKKWERLFGFPRRSPETEIEQVYCDLALAIQRITEDIMLRLGHTAQKLTGSRYLCLAGGVALNCVANGKLLEAEIFKKVWIQPASGDAGGAIGAALAAHHIYFGQSREVSVPDRMQGSYLGPSFNGTDVQRLAGKYRAPFEYFEGADALCRAVANLIAEGKAVGWVQGKMEWGPRALGNRSILGDPTNPEMQKKLNLKIKFRESFRPFAPSVLAEDVQNYFESDGASPYMLTTLSLKSEKRKALPDGYGSLGVKEKLYFQRSEIPAVTHVDFSARVQTVDQKTNPLFWKLINEFKRLSGHGLLVNTSFNVRGEPIVCTPEDAYRCFMRTEMDCLVIGSHVFHKQNQPVWKEVRRWQEDYVLD